MRIDVLRAGMTGRVTAPEDDGWDAARLFHSGIGEPAVIVRPGSVQDVVAAVRWAAEEGQPINVRGGGHSAWGTLPGGLTVDLAELNGVDVEGTVVRVGGGATWGAVAATLAEHGLGISSGDTASVGVGGLTLGGGIGWMVRAWGLAADQLLGVQLVTPAGELAEVSAASHPELFWALRGGGGNFGVVTRFDFRAHALPGVVFAELSVPGDVRPVLRALRDTLRHAPRELTVTYMDVPAMDPSAPAGATITACWIGEDVDAALAALGSLLAVDGVSVTDVGARSYPDVLMDMPPFDPDQPMPGFIGGNTLLVEPDDDVLDALASFREAHEASVLFLRSLGGAFGDVGPDESAFPARNATWFAMAGVFDLPGTTDEQRAAIHAEWSAIAARGAGVYGNFTQEVDGSVVGRIFSRESMARLGEVKREWDPRNLFSRNHNVMPV
ncbi:FAD-binding oxidoreductase [Microbacterium sp. DT81.1]|uniref:FAD-binding oxidoreductase n=1 Tax=Microbacterium sp. DT81.1 TaxID=3393413 RepID=UPI003CF3394D